MRRLAIVLGGILFAAAACNALTGAGDLEVCQGAECSALEAGPTGSSSGLVDASSSGADGKVGQDGSVFDASTCSECPQACESGVCMPFPSCRADNPMCGTTENGGTMTSCCETKPVTGGTFNRVNDEDEPAAVSSFSLDTYDVTVARFRAFVASGHGIATSPPAPGSGAHPKIAGSGWKSAWDAQLANTTALLEGALQGGTYSKAPGPNDQKPITKVTWFEAYAFCIWDGGRLPTFTEWNYAAAGGSEQRVYPWSSPPSSETIDKSRAAYECRFADPAYTCPPPACIGATPAQTGTCVADSCVDAGGTCQTPPCFGCDVATDLAPVGSLPAGAGRWGQLDLAGNVRKIVLDARPKSSGVDLPKPCNDCANLMPEQLHPSGGTGGGSADAEFMFVNGDWGDDEGALHTWRYDTSDFRGRLDWTGFRCARDR